MKELPADPIGGSRPRRHSNSEGRDGGRALSVLVVPPPPMLEVDCLARCSGGVAEIALFADAVRGCSQAQRRSILQRWRYRRESSMVDGIHLDSDAHRVLERNW